MLWVLIRKNWKVLTRENYLAVFCLLSPILLMLSMNLQQYMADSWAKQEQEINPLVESIEKLCGISKVFIGFTHGELDWTDFVIKELSKDLNIDKLPELNQTEFVEKVSRENNSIGVVFCTRDIVVGNDTLQCEVNEGNGYIYLILYNFTYPNEFFVQDLVQNEVIGMKNKLDNAILAWVSDTNQASRGKIELEIQSFPKLDRFFGRYNVVSSSGSMYLVVTSFLLSALLVQEISKEKSEFLKIYLNLNGVTLWNYWVSWIFIGIVLALFCAGLVPLTGWLCGFQEFWNVPLALQLSLFALINISGVLTGALASVFINDVKLGNTVSLSFIIIGICMQLLVCNPGVIRILHSSPMPFWVDILRLVFYIYPPFNFATLYFQVYNLAGVHYDYDTRAWVEGTQVSWSSLLLSESGQLWKKYSFYIPPTLYNLIYLLSFLAVSPVVLAYFDHIVPENRVKTRPWNFIFKISDFSTPLLTKKLELLSVSKKYSERTVLNNVSLSLYSDEILSVIGQNGAGKSTLLGIIAGFIQQTSGEIRREMVRFCPQKNVLWDELTVEEHIFLIASLNKVDPEDVLKDICLEQQRMKRVACLSGGMKRRLSLALTCIGKSDILLLDEPTTGLDPLVKREIWKYLKKVSSGKLVIFTSHSMDEVNALSDSVLFLDGGEVKFHCHIGQLRTQYLSTYTLNITPTDNSFLEIFSKKFENLTPLHPNTLQYSISKTDPQLTLITEFLDSADKVLSWSLSQSILDLFNNLS